MTDRLLITKEFYTSGWGEREKEMMKEDIFDSTQNLGNHSTIILVFLTGAPLLPPNW